MSTRLVVSERGNSCRSKCKNGHFGIIATLIFIRKKHRSICGSICVPIIITWDRKYLCVFSHKNQSIGDPDRGVRAKMVILRVIKIKNNMAKFMIFFFIEFFMIFLEYSISIKIFYVNRNLIKALQFFDVNISFSNWILLHVT